MSIYNVKGTLERKANIQCKRDIREKGQYTILNYIREKGQYTM